MRNGLFLEINFSNHQRSAAKKSQRKKFQNEKFYTHAKYFQIIKYKTSSYVTRKNFKLKVAPRQQRIAMRRTQSKRKHKRDQPRLRFFIRKSRTGSANVGRRIASLEATSAAPAIERAPKDVKCQFARLNR